MTCSHHTAAAGKPPGGAVGAEEGATAHWKQMQPACLQAGADGPLKGSEGEAVRAVWGLLTRVPRWQCVLRRLCNGTLKCVQEPAVDTSPRKLC